MSFLIIISTILTSLFSLYSKVLNYFDYFFTSVFTLEILIKVGHAIFCHAILGHAKERNKILE